MFRSSRRMQGRQEMDQAAQVLVLAQETADIAIAEAKKEAEQIIARAREEAERIIADARGRTDDF